ncbi:TonB-dependent receptor domain-containing protein [Flavobacterium ardleyense]|uniref:TonB-dependent receptor domain-containing protein n=1 Tax=Flavobacterium ardleyense TaxID=2038737 RepID=A0ABW5Z8U0_9FLAO
MKKIVLLLLISAYGFSQTSIKGKVYSGNEPLSYASIYLKEIKKGAQTDENGNYEIKNIESGTYSIIASYMGYQTEKRTIIITTENKNEINFNLKEDPNNLEEVVVSGTMKAVSRMETPVPVEVYTQAFLKKNPTSNIFEALQNVNGVRPQLNCSICNTGDIHINGLEGPYTMVTIDGMPIVSSLSTVYGLSGIPNSLIERVEVVKGPASSLYGSEAVGGLINIITKKPSNAPLFSADIFSTSWLETNVDLAFKSNIGKKATTLVGINYYNFDETIDNNNDNFTDVTLQERVSLFNKWSFDRKDNKEFTLAGRFFYEDRWGGEMQWNKSFRGGDEVYGESIYTTRFELLGKYQLPTIEDMFISFSVTDHDQNSVYGNTLYMAKQKIAFAQYTWDKKIENHNLLLGSAFRHQYYDDNTTGTIDPERSNIYSLFLQDEIKMSEKHTVLLGARYDYNNNHGSIFTPRVAYKWKISDHDVFRINAGTGFRIVNLFTEEHAALTGARDVIITEDLKPEKSYNINLNYLKKIKFEDGSFLGLEASTWYTYFTNQIIPDYDTNPNQIIYSNLNGYAETIGLNGNIDYISTFGLKAIIGFTMLQPKNVQNGVSSLPVLTEKYSVNWALSYDIPKWYLSIDYTGNLYGPMRLPLLGELDPRKEYSPVWSLQNIQFTYKKFRNFELYGGVKNLLNWTPAKGNPFLIAGANDPFDQNVDFDASGNVIATPTNPYALTFDPNYVYAPNQGIRGFLGIRYTIF